MWPGSRLLLAASFSMADGYEIAAAGAKQVVRGRRWWRALQGAVDSTTSTMGDRGAQILATASAKGSEAKAFRL